jgi:molybdopterin synthase sulfur carrier subunit
MEINILAFGQIADIAGKASWWEKDVMDTEALRQLLQQRFPQLDQLNYVIAIDKTITNEKTELHDHAIVALLPPYSGG